MSAFMCSDRHLCALVAFASLHGVSYYWKGALQPVKGEEQRAALILQAANARSVNYRYAHNTEAQCDDDPISYRAALPLPPLHILKLCQSFDYQACEPDDYDESEAKAITRAIIGSAIHKLPGYTDAPWSI